MSCPARRYSQNGSRACRPIGGRPLNTVHNTIPPGMLSRPTEYAVGKTVMLNAAEARARSRDWLVVSETATPGLGDRLTGEHLPRLLLEHGGSGAQSAVGPGSLPAG
ncbi:conserved hypothetical protein [Rhodococcus jostii RHA1]|uniref:Uncharacterized protein n=2 Tax=Nocardiaceae TaxID=85025 RepID=Q0S1Z7_RHOJR|nr:conserved hypothetical protein [Rhodococcus jostii RHA1]